MKARQITLADLAKELNVSSATVSRALKDHPDISLETRQKVKDLAQKLNYRPNTIAQGLRKQESKILGVIIPEIVHHFFSSVISGIMETANTAGYRVMICQSMEMYSKEVEDVEALFSSRVDGILISLANETSNFDHLRKIKNYGLPVVSFDKVCYEIKDHSMVIIDDFEGAYNIIEHLINAGYDKIAHFHGPLNPITSQNRLNAYLKALKDHNIPKNEDYIIGCDKVTQQEGYEFTKQLINMPNRPNAIFAVTDLVAIGAMVAIKEAGLRIPEDIAVVGFSNWAMASVVEPALTTVAQPGFEMGKIATSLLIDEIKYLHSDSEQAYKYQTKILKTKLMIRESTVKTSVLAS
ncbi:LacI family DNA-binding transcriptional regulator [Chondrinema litorale]|uniref:LacI family DNA-binding transcriptional regulator n=1 Tax=Chondrinema litorale TaxID=2994555 RepID=UPI002542D7F5|nr:LacI family DNA-binding transcriptional regulator [Chondrinema litorale]UZR94832.1 LacI family DNA-binding transcriptional regulator [Chondrinema litorale]